MKVKYHGGKPRRIRHPKDLRCLEVGETIDAPEWWHRQHLALFRTGELEEGKASPKKKAPGKRKAAEWALPTSTG